MMPLANFLAVMIIIMVAVILLWMVSIEIVDSKIMRFFLPFFMISIWLCLTAALNFYAVYDQRVWFSVELFWGIWFLWILIILIKNKNV